MNNILKEYKLHLKNYPILLTSTNKSAKIMRNEGVIDAYA